MLFQTESVANVIMSQTKLISYVVVIVVNAYLSIILLCPSQFIGVRRPIDGNIHFGRIRQQLDQSYSAAA